VGWVVPPGPLGEEADIPAARIARALEDPGTARRFADRVAAEAVRAGADLIVMPPVLGLDHTARVHRMVDEALNGPAAGRSTAAASGAKRSPDVRRVTLFELIAPPPSLPGQRLQRALDRAVRRAGVEFLPGTVTSADTGPADGGAPGEAAADAESGRVRRVEAVVVKFHGRTVRVRAGEFVLAAGRFAAGGLASDSDGRLSEPIFGLTVFAPPPPGWPPGRMPVGRRRARDMVWERFRARHGVRATWSGRDSAPGTPCSRPDWPLTRSGARSTARGGLPTPT